MMSFVISSGHGLYVRGAGRFIDEVNEARKVTDKVVDLINKNGGKALKFHDNTSRDKNTNLATIVRFHNGQVRETDVSIHFNASKVTDAPVGVEVLYLTEKALAEKVSLAISKASGLKNRGAKLRKDLWFLNDTKKPAILIEVCFVDSKADVEIYQQKFEEICKAIAEALLDKSIEESNTPEQPKQTENEKVMWGGMELRKGQIGRLTILKPINLWKDNEHGKLEMVRVLNPPEVYRVYGYRDKHQGQYDVGAGLWVTKMDGYVKYETPSKALLEKVK